MNDIVTDTCVLIVEDEPLIRVDAIDMVADEGFAVCDAPNAAKALVILESRDDIGILFTDIDMPGEMDGLDLARTVRKRWPHIAIIIVSGHTRLTDADVPNGGMFFSKPYLRATMLKALHRADIRTRG
ncbi:response regulator [Aureimonas flava]|uniref:Response regulator n=1 Tax=Aureimonas flava TaxID=2320271 RepID=A0A3A1WHM8_9HYPH|nr:response regulator [Aureimonas flava]RIX98702.1 response regulator [Aureimonas flava]